MKKIFFVVLLLACNNKEEPPAATPVQITTHTIIMSYTCASVPVELSWTGNATTGSSPVNYVATDTVYYDEIPHGGSTTMYSIKAKASGTCTVNLYLDGVLNQTQTTADSASVQLNY